MCPCRNSIDGQIYTICRMHHFVVALAHTCGRRANAPLHLAAQIAEICFHERFINFTTFLQCRYLPITIKSRKGTQRGGLQSKLRRSCQKRHLRFRLWNSRTSQATGNIKKRQTFKTSPPPVIGILTAYRKMGGLHRPILSHHRQSICHRRP